MYQVEETVPFPIKLQFSSDGRAIVGGGLAINDQVEVFK